MHSVKCSECKLKWEAQRDAITCSIRCRVARHRRMREAKRNRLLKQAALRRKKAKEALHVS
jgi:hypothetical protein